MAVEPQSNSFETLFQDPLYLEFKNHLYNYRIRRRQIQKQLHPLGISKWILEIGSGISPMTEGGTGVVFSDISWEALHHLKTQQAARGTLVMSVTGIALRTESVPVIVCSEVLEHVREDEKALLEMYRVLEAGGKLILTVPVHPRYYAYDDHYVQHERRYALRPLLRRLRKIGFENLCLVKVTGILDKIAMLALAAIYRVFVTPNRKMGKGKPGIFLKLFLPLYKFLNRIYARMVELEAEFMPLSTTAVVLISCNKKKKIQTIL